MGSGVDFEALGISDPPSWSVLLPDDEGGTQLVEVPQAPEAEGLPLPPNLEVIASFWVIHYYSLHLRSKPKDLNAGAPQICLWILVQACCWPKAYASNKGEPCSHLSSLFLLLKKLTWYSLGRKLRVRDKRGDEKIRSAWSQGSCVAIALICRTSLERKELLEMYQNDMYIIPCTNVTHWF